MRPTHTALTLSAFALALSLPALADEHDHEHAGDIFYVSEEGSIVLDDVTMIDVFTGRPLFEGDFGDLPFGPNGTDDPGFEAESNDGFAAGSFISLTPVGSLLFWNGTAWGAADASVTITATGLLDDVISWTSLGNSGGYALASEAIGSGIPEPGEETHQHLEFVISAGAPIGAYLLNLALANVGALAGAADFSSVLQTSAPFSIAFNFGLEEEDFEGIIDSTSAPVPVPAAVWLLGSSLAGLATCARQRRGNPA